jgi:hypothetical protein
MKEVAEATPKVRNLIEHLRVRSENADAQHWLRLIREGYVSPQYPGGLPGWSALHNNESVDTLQITFTEGHHIQKIWMPGARVMVRNPLGLRFFAHPEDDPSSRKFNGVVTLVATEEVWVGYDRVFLQVLAYRPTLVGEREKV